jgi:hypothetical protein
MQSGADLIQGSGWPRRPADMPKALSFDLRSRVLAAIDAGLSCRQAAARFGVSASSAIRWQGMRRAGGNARPKPQGGDRLSHRTEAHAELIHAALAEVPDITLPELKATSSRWLVALARAPTEPISSAFGEATVNAVVSKRFAKKQQMQWPPRGAHLLLQTRTRTLDGTLRPLFERWYPGLANDNKVEARHATAA